jgi:hypothetical protein
MAYEEKPVEKPWFMTFVYKLGLTNNKSLLLARWITAEGQQQQRFSGRSSSRLPQRRAAP